MFLPNLCVVLRIFQMDFFSVGKNRKLHFVLREVLFGLREEEESFNFTAFYLSTPGIFVFFIFLGKVTRVPSPFTQSLRLSHLASSQGD